MSYTRREYAAAVKAAHDALHETEELSDVLAWQAVDRAHEALHTVYDPQDPPIACGTSDPEAQAMLADLRAMLASFLPCGHALADLVGAPRAVTRCGACLREKQTGTGRFAPEQPEPPEAA